MSKWQKIDPDQIKVGDRVKVRHVSDDYEETTSADVKHVTDLEIGIGPYTLYKNEGTWYIAKPKKAKPPKAKLKEARAELVHANDVLEIKSNQLQACECDLEEANSKLRDAWATIEQQWVEALDRLETRVAEAQGE